MLELIFYYIINIKEKNIFIKHLENMCILQNESLKLNKLSDKVLFTFDCLIYKLNHIILI